MGSAVDSTRIHRHAGTNRQVFPIKAQELPLHKIADYWSRDRFLGATKKELQARLEEAHLHWVVPVASADYSAH
jgi:hypothetical protein